MADIIDAFVVTLGLDPSNYQRQIRVYKDDQKKLHEQMAKDNRAQEDAQRRLTDGVKKLRNETAGFLFMLAGASGVKEFVQSMLIGDAATGRLAANLGIATQNLSAWQAAVTQVGGQAGDANQALQAVVSLYQNYQLGQANPSQLAALQGLGVTDLRDPEKVLMQIAGASQRMPKPEFAARASMLGINANMVNLLEKGPQGVQETLEQMRKIGVATDADAKAAQDFDAALQRIGHSVKAVFRPEIEQTADAMAKWLSNQDNMNLTLDAGIGILGAFAVAAIAASWEILAIAGAITAVLAAYQKLKAVGDQQKRDAVTRDRYGNSVQHGHYVGDVGAKQGVVTHNPDGSSEMTWKDRPLHWVDTGKGQGHWEGVGSGIQNQSGVGPRKGLKVDPWFMPAAAGSNPTVGGGGANGGMADLISGGLIRSGGGSADRAIAFWRSRGASAEAARGIVAAMRAENPNLDPSNTGPDGGTLGLGQWRGDRRKQWHSASTFDQQLAAMFSETVGGDKGGGKGFWETLRNADAATAARLMITRFYRPGVGTQGDLNRAGRYLGTSLGRAGGATNVRQNVNVGTIVINTAATDAAGIARDMRGALAQRGLVAQANQGLAP